MKKIIMPFIGLTLIVNVIKPMTTNQYYSSITKSTTLQKFSKTIAKGDHYKLTNVKIDTKNLATRVFEKNRKHPEAWLKLILPYAILNELEIQLENQSGKHLVRFKKIYERALNIIEENESISYDELNKVLYQTTKGENSFFKYYLSYLIEQNLIITETLKTIINKLQEILFFNIRIFNVEKIDKLLEEYPYLSLMSYEGKDIIKYINDQPIDLLVERYKSRDKIIQIVKDTKESLSNFRASMNFKFKDNTACEIF